jgi:mannose-6-phosphate isomerase-like protein (cupin superfamily)
MEGDPSQQPKPRKIPLENTTSFDRGEFSGKVYISPEDNLGFSALVVEVDGHHPRKRMIEGKRMYWVVDGTGTFTLNDKTEEVKKGDLYIVPEGHEYEYQGKMTLFEFNVSPTNSFKDEKLE